MCLSVRSEIGDEVCESSRLDSGVRLICDIILTKLYCPLGEPARELRLLENAFQRIGDDDHNRMALKVRPEFPS